MATRSLARSATTMQVSGFALATTAAVIFDMYSGFGMFSWVTEMSGYFCLKSAMTRSSPLNSVVDVK